MLPCQIINLVLMIRQMKIRQLELKLLEEEHQRKLVQDKTSQVTKEAWQH